MDSSLPEFGNQRRTNFQKIADTFLSQPGLPFSNILSGERIERVFSKHESLFGLHGVYTTAIMLWSFLGQVLRDGKEASCQSAVTRVVSHCQLTGTKVPTENTGDYCRARAKLEQAAIKELSCEIADQMQQAAEQTNETRRPWLFKGLHAKLIDGFTFTMPDTIKNQAAYPQQKAQKKGVGLPIARCVGILSLATACMMDVAIGPYAGKETGESALLRSVLHRLKPRDLAVMDRYYCSFMMIAMMLAQGTQMCARKHHLRGSDFRRGRRIGKYDHIIIWERPQRPKWMDKATYAQIPETIELRELRFSVVEKGRRTKVLTIITTLTDPEQYSKQEIAQLYGFRWNCELDIRSVKCSMNLGHVRCKSPEMVERELWTTILGYNLIRTTAAAAALLHDKLPRQISFTATCQYVLAAWQVLSAGLIQGIKLLKYCKTMLEQIARCQVANRPGRLEPRVIKRRRHHYKLMQKPRHILKAELRKHCT